MAEIQRLKDDYPWIQTPLIVGAPMRLIALADLASEVSKAGGIGFIGAGTDVSDIEQHLKKAQDLLAASSLRGKGGVLPIGLGFINWGASIEPSLALIQKYRLAAVWLFAPSSIGSLVEWAQGIRSASSTTKIWVQVGSVKEAVDIVTAVHPEVLVVQGTDAGGHGLAQGASIISLLPEVADAINDLVTPKDIPPPVLIAAGGISESRGVAASLILGASGVVMGTRFLASHEAVITHGYQSAVLQASDGGQTTVRTKVYDTLRGTTGWAETHNARGVINKSYVDAVGGMHHEENMKLYEEEVKKGDKGWGVHGRMTTYAGAGVGLVREVKEAGEIVRDVRDDVKALLARFGGGT